MGMDRFKNAFDRIHDEILYRRILLDCRIVEFTEKHPRIAALTEYVIGAATGYVLMKWIMRYIR